MNITPEQARRILEWFDNGMDPEWEKGLEKEDHDLRFLIWMHSISDQEE